MLSLENSNYLAQDGSREKGTMQTQIMVNQIGDDIISPFCQMSIANTFIHKGGSDN